MPVDLEGQLRVGMSQDASDRIEVDARSEGQRGGRVPRIVQAEAARDLLGPQEHPKRGQWRLSQSACFSSCGVPLRGWLLPPPRTAPRWGGETPRRTLAD